MINRCIVQGRLVHDPELRTTNGGKNVCGFTVAWSEKRKDGEDTQLFLNCNAWEKTADMVNNYFTKGKEILVEGRLQTRKYQAKDGSNRSTIEMLADRVHFCGSKSDSTASSSAVSEGSASTPAGFENLENDGNLPF